MLQLVACLFLSGLSGYQVTLAGKTNKLPVNVQKNVLALTFSEEGTLWRVLPGDGFVYVDYSKDEGVSFSQPVKVNQLAQKISAWPENPPAIAVTDKGRIYVLYYVDEQQKSTSYFSYSDDFGKSFSRSKLISDHALTDMHYMDKMLLDNQGNVHFFWHDLRDQETNSVLGGGTLSLYHATASGQETTTLANSLVSHAVCSCCRTAVSLSPEGLPVVLMRMVFNDGARDHALLRKNIKGEWAKPKQISDDHWVIDACPEHGPALVVDKQGKSHLTWFSLGNKRQGIFYAQTDDYGETVSEPMALGDLEFLPSHPDVIVEHQRVVLAWTEFNGKQTSIYIQQSLDEGHTWQTPKQVFATSSSSGYPKLLVYKEKVFISWLSQLEGLRMLEVTR